MEKLVANLNSAVKRAACFIINSGLNDQKFIEVYTFMIKNSYYKTFITFEITYKRLEHATLEEYVPDFRISILDDFLKTTSSFLSELVVNKKDVKNVINLIDCLLLRISELELMIFNTNALIKEHCLDKITTYLKRSIKTPEIINPLKYILNLNVELRIMKTVLMKERFNAICILAFS